MPLAPTEIKSLARSYTNKAIKVLAGVMQQKDAPPAARVAAASALLDRGWGKPHQESTVTVHRGVNELSDAEIAARIAELRGTGAADGDAAAPLDPSQLN